MGKQKLGVFGRIRKTKVYTPGAYKPLPKRLNWIEIEARKRQEGRSVVKGTTKKVIVVKSPNPKIFEQAIFIVKEDFLSSGHGAADVLKEAERVANDYIRDSVGSPTSFIRKIPAPWFAALGAVCMLLLWIGLRAVGVNV